MPTTFRIPKATITGLYGQALTAYARRAWGQVPDNAYVLWHNRKVMKAVFSSRWRDSDVFSPVEREVLGYAEAMSTTPLTVTDEMVASLIDHLGEEAVVELTMLIAIENERARFNSAAGLQAQGFSDVCEVPMPRLSSLHAVPSPA